MKGARQQGKPKTETPKGAGGKETEGGGRRGGAGLYTKLISPKYQTGDVPGRYYGFSIGTGSPLEYDTTYYYDATGRLQRVQGPGLPTGPGAVYSFVANSDLAADVQFKSGPTVTLASTTYTYEANRDLKTNVLNRKDSNPVPQPPAPSNRIVRCQLDRRRDVYLRMGR